MRLRGLLLLAILLSLGAGAGAALAQPVEVNMSVFYDTLAPYGDWAFTSQYGWVWSPRDVPDGWRPYTAGHWAYTEYGWTWVSDYEWGWAPFHYGRWFHDPDWGWRWVPGYEWSPAWVAWHEGGGWVGWAPLPPAVAWSGAALRFGGPGWALEIDPLWFAFVDLRYLLAPRLDTYFVPRERNVTLVRQTVNITNYVIVNDTIVSRALPVDHVERVIGHPVHRLRIVAAPQEARNRQQVRGDELVLFRPAISRAKPAHVPTVTAVAPRRHGEAESGATGGAAGPHEKANATRPTVAPVAAPHAGGTATTVQPHPSPKAAVGSAPMPKATPAPAPVPHTTPHVTTPQAEEGAGSGGHHAKPVASPSPRPSPKASPTPPASPPSTANVKPTPTPAKTPAKAKEKPKTEEDDHKPPR